MRQCLAYILILTFKFRVYLRPLIFVKPYVNEVELLACQTEIFRPIYIEYDDTIHWDLLTPIYALLFGGRYCIYRECEDHLKY